MLNTIRVNKADADYVHSIFDISDYNSGATYSDLSSALAAVPQEKQKGGMSIRYKQTDGNNIIYVQYRLMSNSWSADEANWQSSTPLQQKGQSVTETMSQYAITQALVEANEYAINLQFEPKDFITSNNAVLYVVDQDGYIMAKIDNEGVHAVNINELRSLIQQNDNAIQQTNESIDTLQSFVEKYIDKDDLYPDKLLIVDKLKNIMVEVSSNGLRAASISSLNFSEAIDDTFYLVDSDGNVFLKVTDRGIQALDFIDKDGNSIIGQLKKPFEGYTLYTVGDSLCSANAWQSKFVELTGINFSGADNNYPGYPISGGGTMSTGIQRTSGFFRVTNLKRRNLIQNQGENTIIVIQNSNDCNGYPSNLGTVTDKPLYPKNVYESIPAFTSEALDQIPVSERQIGTMVASESTTAGKKLTINTLPSREGDITLTVGVPGTGTKAYTIHVIPQSTSAETLAYVCERILEVYYTGVSDIQGSQDNEILFASYWPADQLTLSFSDKSNTGMACTVTNEQNCKQFVYRYFDGDSLSEWTNTSKWIGSLTLFQAWKSIIQYIQIEFPKAKIVFAAFPFITTSKQAHALPDGSYDWSSYLREERPQKYINVYKAQKQVADEMSIPFIDVVSLCNMTIANMDQYYYDNNIHPKQTGYDRIGEVMAQQIQSIIK